MIILFTLSPMFADGHILYFLSQNGFLFFCAIPLFGTFFLVSHSIESASPFWVTLLLSWALWAQLSPLLSKTSQLSTLLSKSARLSTFLIAQKSMFTLESTFFSGFTLLSAQKNAQKSKTTQNSAQKSAQAQPEPTSAGWDISNKYFCWWKFLTNILLLEHFLLNRRSARRNLERWRMAPVLSRPHNSHNGKMSRQASFIYGFYWGVVLSAMYFNKRSRVSDKKDIKL